MTTKKIRQEIEEHLRAMLKEGKGLTIKVDEDAYGHLAGTRVEEWMRQRLIKKNWQVFYPNTFLEKVFRRVGRDRQKIEKIINENWWGSLLVTRRQIFDFLDGKHIGRWQQEAADLVLFYENDILKDSENVVLLNVKSHNISRESRPPNIMSAQRLLEFLHKIVVQKGFDGQLEKVQLWFLGVGYISKKSIGTIQEVHLKDLFKLDISEIPQINFDAAIQIQWHVKDMIEIKQSKKEFVRNLAKTFLDQWREHAKGKGEKYTKLVKDIEEALSS